MRILADEYGYAKNQMAREVGIFYGRNELKDADGNVVRADIVVYENATACRTRDQGKVLFIVECKAQNKASSDEEDPGDWSVCDVRIFDLRYTDADGFETTPAQEMNAEFRLFEHMEAGFCKIVLLTDEQDDLTGDSEMINVDSVMTRNNHTLEITRDENNMVAGFKFRAEAISLVALLTRTVPDPESDTTPETDTTVRR